MLTEGFFDHLREHAVPLDENAIRQLRDSATALDLYTWLAYRLPRLSKNRPVLISWPQLAVHFGNEGKNIRKFRQTIRDAWDRHVSAVYPDARAEFDTTAVRLYPSPAPLSRRPLSLVSVAAVPKTVPAEPSPPVPGDAFLAALRATLGAALARSCSPTLPCYPARTGWCWSWAPGSRPTTSGRLSPPSWTAPQHRPGSQRHR